MHGLAVERWSESRVKALLVAAGGVVDSFGPAWLFIDRVPGVSRVL